MDRVANVIAFVFGAAFVYVQTADCRRRVRHLMQRLAHGRPLTGEFWQHRITRDVRTRNWTHAD